MRRLSFVELSETPYLSFVHQIEALEEVERAFVHVDYAARDMPEHKVWDGGTNAYTDTLLTELRVARKPNIALIFQILPIELEFLPDLITSIWRVMLSFH